MISTGVSTDAHLNVSGQMFKYILDDRMREERKKRLYEKEKFYYIECLAGTIIITYGLVSTAASIYNPFKLF